MESSLANWVLWNMLNILITKRSDVTGVFKQTNHSMSVFLPAGTKTEVTNATETKHTLQSTMTADQTPQSLKHVETDRTVHFSQSTQQITKALDDIEVAQNVPLRTYNLASCVHSPDPELTIEGANGHIHYQSINESNEKQCIVKLRVLPNKIIQFRISVCRSMNVEVTEEVHKSVKDVFRMQCSFTSSLPLVYSLTDTFVMIFRFFASWTMVYEIPELSLYFSAVNKSQRPELELMVLSPSVGYIQTPGWDGSTPYPPFLRSCVMVTPPTDHVIFLSFLRMDSYPRDELAVFPGQCDSKVKFLKRFSGRKSPGASIFPDDFIIDKQIKDNPLSFSFSGKSQCLGSGFKLRYSFHSNDLKPEQVPGLWEKGETRRNCSVTVWPDLWKHFPCDLIIQCANSEDEIRCPYFSEKCGLNKAEAGGRCYIYNRHTQISWFDSDRQCRQYGALLASVETYQKWNAVVKLLEHCVDFKKRCDSQRDCVTNLDEEQCPDNPIVHYAIKPPAFVNFDRPGGFRLTPLLENDTQCPDTHFQCNEEGYCLPVYVRCNDVNDCPGHEDEAWCNHYRCPGFYRCRGSGRTLCVHVDHLCDGWPQCPRHDDELLCNMTCPEPCTCYGLAFTCTHTFQVTSFPQLRYLEARDSGLHQADVIHNIMLIHLGVQACGWSNVTAFTLPNLHSLDLSDNLLYHVNFSHIKGMHHLQRLNMAGNPISGGLSDVQGKYLLPSLEVFNFSRVQIGFLNMSFMSDALPNLQVLDLSLNGIKSLQGRHLFQTLRVLDLRGCPVSYFTPDFMKSMTSIMRVFADNFKLCCSAVLPDVFRGECTAPSDETELSSCDDLLKSSIYRYALSVFAVLAIGGNSGSFVYRLCSSSGRIKTGFAVFVLHLCVSDFLMGVYLAFIGIADQVYTGIYVWNDTAWKRSIICSIAGFLSFLSSEVSAFLICLITLDRFLALCFPFSQARFGTTSAHIACVVIWALGLILAIVPLLPITSHWEFYHQTGICIPLPVTRADFAGHSYSFSVMIVCNLVLFLMIGMGQCLIYWSIRSNSMSKQTTEAKNKDSDRVKSKETTIARRLLTIAVSDFLCWFPIGVCGVLAAFGVAIPGEVNVAMAIFVLPLNSALNPFLYTLNVILEKRQKAQELRFQQFLCAQLKSGLRYSTTLN